MLELAQPKFDAAGVADQIEVLVGSATDSIEILLKRGERFDIAFLDADKSGYLGYYKQLMNNQLINPGGIVVVDNALMKVSLCRCTLLFLLSGLVCQACICFMIALMSSYGHLGLLIVCIRLHVSTLHNLSRLYSSTSCVVLI